MITRSMLFAVFFFLYVGIIQSYPVVDPKKSFFNYIKNMVESGKDINQPCTEKCKLGITTLLNIAIQNASIGCVRYLIRHGADVNKTDSFGRAPLHSAAERHSPGMVDILIENHADVNLQNFDGYTPLHILMASVSVEGTLATAQRLIRAGALLNQKNFYGETPLMLACYSLYGSKFKKDLVRLLLDNNALCNQLDNAHNSELHLAVENACVGVVKILLEGTSVRTVQNSSPNIRNEEGETPLHKACGDRCLEKVLLLLMHGADVTIKNNTKKTPLMLTIEGMRNIVRDEFSDGKKRAREEKEAFNVFNVLIHDPRQDFTVRDKDNNSLLHYVAHYDYTTKLLGYMMHITPADINARDIRQKTPLYYAIERGNFSGIIELLMHGAQAAVRDERGVTPLGVLLTRKIDKATKLNYARILISYCGSMDPYLLSKNGLESLSIDTLSEEDKNEMGIDDTFIAQLKDSEALAAVNRPFIEHFLKNNYSKSSSGSMVRLLQNREIGLVGQG